MKTKVLTLAERADRRQRRLAADIAAGRKCRASGCESWRGMVKRGPYLGLCARCAAEQLESDLLHHVPGAPSAVAALDKAEFEEQLEQVTRVRRAGVIR